MLSSETKEMVYVIGKMLENMEKLVEEMKSLQNDIETKLDQSDCDSEEEQI